MISDPLSMMISPRVSGGPKKEGKNTTEFTYACMTIHLGKMFLKMKNTTL
jgi:hypothetical protein